MTSSRRMMEEAKIQMERSSHALSSPLMARKSLWPNTMEKSKSWTLEQANSRS